MIDEIVYLFSYDWSDDIMVFSSPAAALEHYQAISPGIELRANAENSLLIEIYTEVSSGGEQQWLHFAGGEEKLVIA